MTEFGLPSAAPPTMPPSHLVRPRRTAPMWLVVLALAIGAFGLLVGVASFINLIQIAREAQTAISDLQFQVDRVDDSLSVTQSDLDDLTTYATDLREWAAVATDATVNCVNAYMDAASSSPSYYTDYYCGAPGSYAP